MALLLWQMRNVVVLPCDDATAGGVVGVTGAVGVSQPWEVYRGVANKSVAVGRFRSCNRV